MVQSDKNRQYIKLLSGTENHARCAEQLIRDVQPESTEEQVFTLVFAPVITEFAEWVLGDALRRGIRRLYFLSRDGYLMYRAACRISKSHEYPIECRYLNVSRYSVRNAEYRLMADHGTALICSGGIDISFRKIMHRACLTAEEAERVAEETGFSGREGEVLNILELADLKERLGKCTYFLESVDKHSEEAFPAVIGYFSEQGLFDEVEYALVDSGWIGTLQRSIETVVQTQRKNKEISGYYFGLYEFPEAVDKGKYRSFYFGKKDHIGRKVGFSNCLFEAVFSSEEGMTLGYERDEETGKYIPVKSERKNPNAKWMSVFEGILEKYQDLYAESLQESPSATEDKQTAGMVQKLLTALMGEPTKEEAEAFGNFLFCDDVLEQQMQHVAADLSEEEIRNLEFLNKLKILKGLKKAKIHESAWIEGSIVKLGSHVKRNLRHAVLYKWILYIRKRVIN